ncbi:NAD(P)H-binding protein [Paenibacillus rigui]|uniref:Oxidoreductase n=1 Tax=Paenibacillus rigui TaxID=554312 RepID=A0A229UGG0_9BACL|nr:NAD(P)H-binding protein [Paenibacillus rigui]OXM82440.1 oxidoreductase [Paenibacillus rigui]
MTRTAIVAGSTGLIGNGLVQKLLQHSGYGRVITLVRRPTGLQHQKLIEQVVSFDDLLLEKELLQDADVFCTLGTTMKQAGSKDAFRKVDYEYPIRLAKQAAQQGAAQYLIVTAMGADKQSSIFYSRVKGEVEDALRSLHFPALHLFRPSLLLGERAQFRFGERASAVAMKLLGFAFAGPLRKYKAIPASAVAEAMLRAALAGRSGVQVYESDAIEDLAAGK